MKSQIGLNPEQAEMFWGEIAPSEHFAQFYDTEDEFLATLTSFVGDGLIAGESAIVVATPEHERALSFRLMEAGVELESARNEDRYITVDAEETLATFMVNGWPDDQLFADAVAGLISRATANNRRARAFGEMVAMLWARGQAGATVRLEHLWNQFCKSYAFPLFCAYPKAGFTKGPVQSLNDICLAHSKLLIRAADEPELEHEPALHPAD